MVHARGGGYVMTEAMPMIADMTVLAVGDSTGIAAAVDHSLRRI